MDVSLGMFGKGFRYRLTYAGGSANEEGHRDVGRGRESRLVGGTYGCERGHGHISKAGLTVNKLFLSLGDRFGATG